jgi:hypothetical protein
MYTKHLSSKMLLAMLVFAIGCLLLLALPSEGLAGRLAQIPTGSIPTVTGTPVGCACGDGVVDWKRVIDIVKTCPSDIVFSVEVGNVPDAIRSFEHLCKLI